MEGRFDNRLTGGRLDGSQGEEERFPRLPPRVPKVKKKLYLNIISGFNILIVNCSLGGVFYYCGFYLSYLFIF